MAAAPRGAASPTSCCTKLGCSSSLPEPPSSSMSSTLPLAAPAVAAALASPPDPGGDERGRLGGGGDMSEPAPAGVLAAGLVAAPWAAAAAPVSIGVRAGRRCCGRGAGRCGEKGVALDRQNRKVRAEY